MDIKDTVINLMVIALVFTGGYYFGYKNCSNEYQERIVLYQAQVESYKDLMKNVVNVSNENKSEVSYVAKNSDKDNDVEINDGKSIKIKYNGNKLDIPNSVNEDYKFENGKLVINRQEQYALDLTANIDGLVEDRAKRYSRVGKADFGLIYNSEGSDWYGGIRYNAKAYDIGYYHSVNDNDWLIGVHYKF